MPRAGRLLIQARFLLTKYTSRTLLVLFRCFFFISYFHGRALEHSPMLHLIWHTYLRFTGFFNPRIQTNHFIYSFCLRLFFSLSLSLTLLIFRICCWSLQWQRIFHFKRIFSLFSLSILLSFSPIRKACFCLVLSTFNDEWISILQLFRPNQIWIKSCLWRLQAIHRKKWDSRYLCYFTKCYT